MINELQVIKEGSKTGIRLEPIRGNYQVSMKFMTSRSNYAEEERIAEWMLKGKNNRIQKDLKTGTNYRLIMCLPIRKNLTALIREEGNYSLGSHELLPEEYFKETSDMNHLLHIDQYVIKEVKTKKENLSMACTDYIIDYRKVHKIILQPKETTTLGKNMDLEHSDDIHFDSFYLAVNNIIANNIIANKMQDILLNNWIFWLHRIFFK